MITDRIGRHEVLLEINHNHYNFRKTVLIGKKLEIFQNSHRGKYLKQRHNLKLQILPFWKSPSRDG